MSNKILIVDDEFILRDALEIFLNDKGYKTKTVEDGIDALETLKREDFDIILSDIKMYKMDGIALAKNLRKINNEMGIILITAYPELENVIEALRIGVDDYLIKPFELDELENKITNVLKKRKQFSEYYYNQKYEQAKKDFIIKVAHEFRTPLTPIEGFVTLLLKQEFGELSEMQKNILKNVYRNSKRLSDLIGDLIMLYSINELRAPLDIYQYKFDEIINGIIREEESFLKVKQQKVEVNVYDNIDYINCDLNAIKRVIYHLLDNAIKFSPRSSKIIIEVNLYKGKEKDYVQFSITDNSNPIPDEEARKIFKRFYNLTDINFNKTIETSKGLGVGLALAKSIIEAHNGKIWVENVKGKRGNIFRFIIPLNK